MAKQWDEVGLRSIWNSLFNASQFSTCKENDVDLQGVSMLLKKTFYAFEKLKDRCDEAENAKRKPCDRCSSLEKVVRAHEVKLKQTESRMKSIARILNMGGLSQDGSASPGKQQSMARALTQMLFADETAISEDESDTEERSAKRKRCNAIQVVVTPQKKKKSPLKVIVPESLPAVPRRNLDCPQPTAVPESLCSQTAAPTDVVFLSDNDETFLEPPTTPVERPKTPVRPAPSLSQSRTSPIIRSKSIASKRTRLRVADRSLEGRDDGNNCSLITSSPPLVSSAGPKRSPFTPKTRLTRDKTNLDNMPNNNNTSNNNNNIVEALVTAHGKDASSAARTDAITKDKTTNLPSVSNVEAPVSTPVVSRSDRDRASPASADATPDIFRSPNVGRRANVLSLSKKNATTTPASDFFRTLTGSPDVAGKKDDALTSPSLLHGALTLAAPRPTESRPRADVVEVRSTGSAEVDNMLDLMMESRSEVGPARRRADFWKLKPAPCSKEAIDCRANGMPKLKQTCIALGVRPERTDVCTLREFNGGVRASQTEFNGGARGSQPGADSFAAGIRPGQTSTLLLSEDAEFERAILESLKDTDTQFVPDDDEEDFVSPSPDVTLSKQFVSSQRGRRAAGESKENDGDAERLLDEMGVPTLDLVRGYDRVPKRHDGAPDYKYKRDAVRKQDERRKLNGWDCEECKTYYDGRVNDSAERKQLMDRCSKHRDKFKRNDTPPGYWDTEFPSTQELRARNLDITQKPVKFRTRKKI